METETKEGRVRRFWVLTVGLGVLVGGLVLLRQAGTPQAQPGRGGTTSDVKTAAAAEPGSDVRILEPERVEEAKQAATELYREAFLTLVAAPPPEGKGFYYFTKPRILARLAALDIGAVRAMLADLKEAGAHALAEAFAALDEGWTPRVEGLAEEAEKHITDEEERDRMYESLAVVLSSRGDLEGAARVIEKVGDPRLRSFHLAGVAKHAKTTDPARALDLCKKAFIVAQGIPPPDPNAFVALNRIAYELMDLDLELALAVSRAGRRENLPDKLMMIAERVAPKERQRAVELLEEAAEVAAGSGGPLGEAKGFGLGGCIKLPDARIEIARKMAQLDKERALRIASGISDATDRLSAFALLARDAKETNRRFALKCLDVAMNDPAYKEGSFHHKEGVIAALAALDSKRAIKLAREQGGVSALPVVARELLSTKPDLAVSLAEEFLTDAAKRNWWEVDSSRFETALTVLATKDLERAISLAKSRPRPEMAVSCLLAMVRHLAKESPEPAEAALQQAFQFADEAEDPNERYHLLDAVAGAAALAGHKDLSAGSGEKMLEIVAAGNQPTYREPTETDEEYRSRLMAGRVAGVAPSDPRLAIESAKAIPAPRYRAHATVLVADALLKSVGIEPADTL